MEKIPLKRYTYPMFSRLTRFVFIVVWEGAFVLSIRILIIDIINSDKSSLQLLNELAPFALFTVGALIALLVSLNWDSHISISSEGIALQYFIFWHRFIILEDVREIRQSIFPGHRLIIVRHLSPIHRLYGMMYGLTLKPCIFVRGFLNDFDEAITTIRKQIDKHDRINAA